MATKSEAEKVLHQLAITSFAVPGDSSWGLGGMYPPPKSAAEGEAFKAYFKQCREEVGLRMVHLMYLPDGSKNKWWQCFAKRKVHPRPAQPARQPSTDATLTSASLPLSPFLFVSSRPQCLASAAEHEKFMGKAL